MSDSFCLTFSRSSSNSMPLSLDPEFPALEDPPAPSTPPRLSSESGSEAGHSRSSSISSGVLRALFSESPEPETSPSSLLQVSSHDNNIWSCLLNPQDAFDIDALAQSARKSFQVLEPWFKATKSSNNQLATAVVGKMIRQAGQYIIAIDLSITVAQKGCTLADEAINLCDLIQNRRESVTVDKLEPFLEDMLTIAEDACASSSEANEQFCKVRVEIFQVQRDIQDSLEHMQDIGDLNVASLPDPLPTEVFDVDPKDAKLLTERKTRPVTFHDAETRLEQALADVVKFADSLTNFVDWWNNMKTDLMSLKRGVKFIKLDGSNPLRDETVRSGWAKVKGKYQVYQSQISLVRDYYPQVQVPEPEKPEQFTSVIEALPEQTLSSTDVTTEKEKTDQPPNTNTDQLGNKKTDESPGCCCCIIM